MRRLTPLIGILFCLSAHTASSQHKPVDHVDPSTYVIFPFDKTRDLPFSPGDHPRAATLSAAEVDEMEPLVDSAYQKLFANLPVQYPGKKPLSTYKRQYIAILNGKGEKEIWIDFFCRALSNWRQERRVVEDGGACYLHLRINLTLHKASKLMANGLA